MPNILHGSYTDANSIVGQAYKFFAKYGLLHVDLYLAGCI